eukprot:Pgem_evm2s7706
MSVFESMNETISNFDYTKINPDMTHWEYWQIAAFWVAVIVGQEGLAFVMEALSTLTNRRIPVSGSHLDELGWKDWAFIYFNRFSAPMLFYHMVLFSWRNPQHVEWDLSKLTIFNTFGSVILCYLVYDFFYVQFHKFLHIRAIYPYIHKHHHRQMAPSRGNVDASNTHPIEFVCGEYLHLVAIWLVPIHFVGVIAFLLSGGVLASLNHTRYDLQIPFFYDVKAHDTHHRKLETNYGQYMMVWDALFGSFRKYNKEIIVEGEEKEAVNDKKEN